MQVFPSARFAVISWLMVKAHLLLCSRWCWMEPGGVIGESSKEPANHQLIITFIQMGWFMDVYVMVISTKSVWTFWMRDPDLERHALKTNTVGTLINVLMGEFHQSSRPHTTSQCLGKGTLRNFDHGMKRCMLDTKWYLFPKRVNM